MGSDDASGHGRHTILVVDDQAVNRLLLCQYLEAEGYDVELAEDGASALEVIAKTSVDMVLLDVVMKDLDGYEVCRRIKANENTMFIPVVMVTILKNRQDRIKAIEAGADEFLSRPIYPEELLARVRSLLRWQEARRELERSQRDQIRNAFTRYMCPKVVDDILASSTSNLRFLLDETKRSDAVVLFTDLRGFTTVSEHMPADRVVGLLNEYFSAMTQAAHAYEGTLFNMLGDGLLVGFGVPFEQENPADRAMDAALDMQRAFAELSARWQQSYDVVLGLGIGINRGEVVYGHIGSDVFMNYTIIGDTVNVADRLQQIARGGEIVISQSVVQVLSGERPSLCQARTQPVTLKGRREAIHVFSCRPGLS